MKHSTSVTTSIFLVFWICNMLFDILSDELHLCFHYKQLDESSEGKTAIVFGENNE